MKRIAMVVDGYVENIAVWDGVSPWQPEGYVLVDVSDLPVHDVQVGSKYERGVFVDA